MQTESPLMNRLLDQAELRQAKKALLRFLNYRFPGAVTKEVVDTLMTQQSLPLFNTWFDQAFTAGSLDEFVAFLDR